MSIFFLFADIFCNSFFSLLSAASLVYEIDVLGSQVLLGKFQRFNRKRGKMIMSSGINVDVRTIMTEPTSKIWILASLPIEVGSFMIIIFAAMFSFRSNFEFLLWSHCTTRLWKFNNERQILKQLKTLP